MCSSSAPGTQGTSPRDFGFVRGRWTCECLAILVLELASVRVSGETVRRWLHQENLVCRRPRPVLRPEDPERAAIFRRLGYLLRILPPNEIAVFQDVMDVNTNPKLGCMWMRRAQRARRSAGVWRALPRPP
ncbi:MAG: winged helix-turn-helix domain-containing protein [Phycisphaerae bacterium]